MIYVLCSVMKAKIYNHGYGTGSKLGLSSHVLMCSNINFNFYPYKLLMNVSYADKEYIIAIIKYRLKKLYFYFLELEN